MNGTPDLGWPLAVVLVALVAAAVVVARAGRLGVERDQLTAAARAVVQLAVVSLVIAVVLESLPGSFAFVGLMYLVATGTAVRRLDVPRRQAPWVALAVATGAAPVVALCLASGVIPLNGAGVIPVASIVIGGAMTAATLTGRRAADELTTHHPTYEAAVALGLPSPEAAYLTFEPTAREALLPGLDQTRTVGLVTLPGAFIGVLLGGGSPAEAGAAQVLVLFGLMAAQAATCAVLLRLIASARVVRRDLAAVFPR